VVHITQTIGRRKVVSLCGVTYLVQFCYQ